MNDISFTKEEDKLLLNFSTYDPWLFKMLNEKEYNLKKVFNVNKNLILDKDISDDYENIVFVLGVLEKENDYFKINGDILSIKQNIFIHKDIDIKTNFFIGVKGLNIFKKISRVVSEDIYVGGNKKENIPVKEFKFLIKNIPNGSEIEKYIDNRVSVVLNDYFESASKVRDKYQKYLNKKPTTKGKDLVASFKEEEINKYKTILDKLEDMLKNQDDYIESQWQSEIIEIILLLYPKYIYAFREAPVEDIYTNSIKKIDIILIDSMGNIDLVEIKRPKDYSVITNSPGSRNNFLPKRDLSESIMQIEKYVYYLNKTGEKGEERIRQKFQSEMVNGFKLSIINPKGLVIMGRSNNFSSAQLKDFEIIKRKYRNIVDIVTYDDLLFRLKTIIKIWQKK